MTASDLHNLIVASGLPGEKWPCFYGHDKFNDPELEWLNPMGDDVIGEECAALMFTAVLVEELLSTSDKLLGMNKWSATEFSVMVGDGGYADQSTDPEPWVRPTLLEALCAAYREVKK